MIYDFFNFNLELAEQLGFDILSSVARVVCGSLIGAALGIFLSIFRFSLPEKWQSRVFIQLLFEAPKYPPPIAWIPFVILFFGIHPMAPIFIVVIGVTPIMFTHCFEALGHVPIELKQIAASLQLSNLQKIWCIYIPSIRHQILTGFRLSFNMGWMCIIAAEMMSSQSGLGYGIQLARIDLNYVQVLIYIITIGLIGYFFQKIISRIEIKLVPWSHQYQVHKAYD